jgi:hypothetical protein
LRHTISIEARGAFAATAADDGDGDLDALVASVVDDTIAWYENASGDGSAWVPHLLSVDADAPRSIATAELDGDGDLDVLAASSLDDTLAWYRNDSVVVFADGFECGDAGAWSSSMP